MNTTRRRRATRAIALLTVIASTAASVIHAACWDTGTAPKPDSIYSLSGPAGTVLDSTTLLMWKRCAEGLSGIDCLTGSPLTMDWDTGNATATGSNLAEYTDWRVPTLAELQSLLASDCDGPKINRTVFPNTPSGNFWSGSLVAGSPNKAWAVSFVSGNSAGVPFLSSNYVRLVRAGSSFVPTPQTLTFSVSLPFGGTAVAAATSAAPNSTNPIVYASTSPTVCTVNASSGVVSAANTALVGDTCAVSANQSGGYYHGHDYAPATPVTQLFTVSQGTQSLTFGASPSITVGSTGSLSATSDKGLTPVTLTSATLPVCTISDGAVSGVSAGTCTIHAAHVGDGTYSATTASLSFTVSPAPLICNLHMDGVNPLLASKEGLILTRAMLGLKGSAVTDGTGITTPWETIRVDLNAKCGTAFLP